MKTVTSTAEQVDISGSDPLWKIPAGTVLSVISDEGDWLMVECLEHPEYGVFGIDKSETIEFGE